MDSPTTATASNPRDELRPSALAKLEIDLAHAMIQLQCYESALKGTPNEPCFDRLDQAAVIFDRDQATVMKWHWSGVVSGLKIAIERVKSPEFGKCQTCRGDIEIDKLDLSPAADNCIQCTLKKREEGKKKIN